MTANFDVAKSAALAITMLDWREHGQDYARAMVRVSQALAEELALLGVPVFQTGMGMTDSHQFALKAQTFGGGQTASKKLRKANLLVSGIGLPIAGVSGDLSGIRIGTPEIVRWGVNVGHTKKLAELISRALEFKRSRMPRARSVALSRAIQELALHHQKLSCDVASLEVAWGSIY